MPANGERTEKATARRRRRAREEGQFAYSRELTSALTIAIPMIVIFYTMRSGAGFRSLMEALLAAVIRGPQSQKALLEMIRQTGVFFLTTITPVLGAAFVASLAGSVIQGLPMSSAGAATLKWDHLNPVRGFSKLKAKLSWIEWLKILALGAVAIIAVWTTISLFWDRLVALPARDVASSVDFLRAIARRLIGYLVGAAVILGAADYFLQRWRFEKSIMQTKSEVKEDAKAMDGNPLVRGKIRSIQRAQARRRMMSRVKDAHVIVTNPTHYAVALEYEPDTMAAPRVVAKGAGWLAKKIKALGREYDIPTVENVPLARALYKDVELEQTIPMELYKAVAEVLAYVYRVRKGRQMSK
jgi:flagellar biosynthetic protein FlhB